MVESLWVQAGGFPCLDLGRIIMVWEGVLYNISISPLPVPTSVVRIIR